MALVCVQASCKLGCTMASRWEPQTGNVSCSQLERKWRAEVYSELPLANLLTKEQPKREDREQEYSKNFPLSMPTLTTSNSLPSLAAAHL